MWKCLKFYSDWDVGYRTCFLTIKIVLNYSLRLQIIYCWYCIFFIIFFLLGYRDHPHYCSHPAVPPEVHRVLCLLWSGNSSFPWASWVNQSPFCPSSLNHRRWEPWVDPHWNLFALGFRGDLNQSYSESKTGNHWFK